MEYLFRAWKGIEKDLKDKFVFLFLDYDGTLTPIVNTPQKATLRREVRELLRQLSANQRLKLAIISGRALWDIKGKLNLRNIIYAGNHGMELRGPKINFKASLPESYRRALREIKRDLSRKLTGIKGVIIEDKGLSLSLHYRLADERDVPKIKTVFHETLILYTVANKIKTRPGKKILEIRPPLEWDKGRIVLWLLARQQFSRLGSSIMPIYVGDDLTDEDAFKVLNNKGITVFVGKPKRSFAHYYLKDTKEVRKLLQLILKIYAERN